MTTATEVDTTYIDEALNTTHINQGQRSQALHTLQHLPQGLVMAGCLVRKVREFHYATDVASLG